ncbi:protein-tyrosine phosphatase-like protein [Mycena metata]|uniref:protein-tyrosine-phosphatase n=1 Tax=Mycena metata TaxID=1033252 RepID=A0AAD7IBE7_9AGAR|nr:protein-tyrosine phosphatase-like protein [Mycena metata]
MSSVVPQSSRMDATPTEEDITEILPNLFLGSEAGTRSFEMLHERGITHILTLTGALALATVELSSLGGPDATTFVRMRITVRDYPDEELFTHFRATNAFIDAARTAGQGVLVHCHQGVSRSVTVVAAYLMANYPPLHGAEVSAIIIFLRERRSVVQPNWGFLEQLAIYRRCNCDLEANPTAVEAWRAGRNRRWQLVDRRKRVRKEGVWKIGCIRASRWVRSFFR